MKIIISPAKTMNVDRESHEVRGLPRFFDETKLLMDEIRKLSFDEAKALWKCSDRLAELNFQRFAKMDLERDLTPAVFSYEDVYKRQTMHSGEGSVSLKWSRDLIQRDSLNIRMGLRTRPSMR